MTVVWADQYLGLLYRHVHICTWDWTYNPIRYLFELHGCAWYLNE